VLVVSIYVCCVVCLVWYGVRVYSYACEEGNLTITFYQVAYKLMYIYIYIY